VAVTFKFDFHVKPDGLAETTGEFEMKKNSKISVLAMAVLMGATALTIARPTFAADAVKPTLDAVAGIAAKAKDDAIINTVEDAYKGLREIRAARLAIFNGSTEDALKLATEAQTNLQSAEKQMAQYSVQTKKPAAKGDAYIPFDTSMTLSEGFKATPEKQAGIAKANEHIAKGESKMAVEVLKASNIDVTLSAALIPASASVTHVSDAIMLMKENKFYEANLALKAIEDSVIIDSYSADTVPAQGAAG
jgi:YfdX protein